MSQVIQYTTGPVVYAWTALAVAVFILLLFIPAPYGRHAKNGWGPMIPARHAWIAMEIISPAVMVITFVTAGQRTFQATLLMSLWLGHYIYRTLVFPFLLRPGSHPVPLSIVIMSVIFNTVNAGINGIFLFHYAKQDVSGPWNPVFLAGFAIFFTGFAIHVLSDRSLRHLRQSNDSGYGIPVGGLFVYVSCPNYLGEIIEWIGWAVACLNPAALSFALWTIANLVPRALAHHRWYKRHFPDYPRTRRAVVPFIL